jgi:hypothetical protein
MIDDEDSVYLVNKDESSHYISNLTHCSHCYEACVWFLSPSTGHFNVISDQSR